MKQKVKINLVALCLTIITNIYSSLVSNNVLISNTEKLVSTLGEIKKQLPSLPPRPLPRDINKIQDAEVFLDKWKLEREVPSPELIRQTNNVIANLEGILTWVTSSAGKNVLSKLPELKLRNFKVLVKKSMQNIKNAFSGADPSRVEIRDLADKLSKAVG